MRADGFWAARSDVHRLAARARTPMTQTLTTDVAFARPHGELRGVWCPHGDKDVVPAGCGNAPWCVVERVAPPEVVKDFLEGRDRVRHLMNVASGSPGGVHNRGPADQFCALSPREGGARQGSVGLGEYDVHHGVHASRDGHDG